MIRLDCDYGGGAAPEVLGWLCRTNAEQTPGYGADAYCAAAAARIRALCCAPQADVHFFVGATQANLTVIAAALRPWQGVLCADSAHIHVHEAGAVEAAGHKCLVLPGVDGKLDAARIEAAASAWQADPNREHTVQPGMVYLSQPTECGTLYTKAELTAIRAVCRRYDLTLFVDGARLACALASGANDLSLAELASLCDAFYLGGTKCGALFGEALVLTGGALRQGLRSVIKQRGGLLAKGRLLGGQFLALLGEDGPLEQTPYLRMAAHANAQAARIRAALRARGCAEGYEGCVTNQLFFVLPPAWMQRLSRQFVLCPMGCTADGRPLVRICTSWATREEDVDALLKAIAAL